ncbi:type II toxin-antitoxin system Phd/YefM family antitoxin [Agromyces archimandritae]|uniref:Type II toxin-antitoxin system prevent-host-death family antitoxin n=1 Tax=Agromyces archimandritae TaxID=2781962 RepID=A0A975IPU4_9MICO|nr:type II toxin-antitoxin system prevent-host-death family antitoxin [Agromyces archimandritae]QTX06008.1 type II toxin-antitoxin system prevent-host-death family antitoxin [Agromyces archimandritae]
MKTVSVGELRQNPTDALNRVSDGETLVIVKHRRPIADLVPHVRRTGVPAAEAFAALSRVAFDPGMADDIGDARRRADRDYWAD